MKENKEYDAEPFINLLRSHPFIAFGFICLLINEVIGMSSSNRISAQGFCFVIVLAAIGVWYIYSSKSYLATKINIIISCSALLVFGILIVLSLKSNQTLFFVFLSCVLAVLAIACFLYIKGKLTTRNIILLLGIFSLLLRVMYIIYTPYNVRQHDSYSIESSSGHLTYIQYLFNYNFQLPNFDPRSIWQFYQPPVHYYLAALWLKFNCALGMEYTQAIENIQVLTLFYSGCINILCYKIFKEFDFKKLALIIPFAIVCFNPTLIILSGSINNDVLCFVFMLGAVLATIRWYKNPNIISIIKIAIFVGLSMTTKASGAMVAPAIAIVFLIKLFQEKDKFKKLIKQFVVFGVVCVPLGMCWSAYNFIKYGMPINYVPKLGTDINQYIGSYSIFERFFDTNPQQLSSIYTSFGGAGYYEHNIFIALLKCSVFGEYTLSENRSYIVLPSNILFYVNLFLVLISLACMIFVLVKKSDIINKGLKTFFFVLYSVIFVSYIKFCFDYPHVCTQDFRYIAILFVIGTIAIGATLSNLQNRKSSSGRLITSCIIFITVLFCTATTCVYSLLSIVS